MTKDEQNIALQNRVDRLTVLLEAALARIRRLEQQLDKNSRNSDKPSSSDGLTKQAALLRKRGLRKPGGQAGHPGKTLKMVQEPIIGSYIRSRLSTVHVAAI